MERYRFQLESLLHLRKAERDGVRRHLGKALEAERILSEQIAAVEADIVAVQEMQRKALSAKPCDVNHVMESQRYESILKSQQQVMNQQKETIETEIEKRRAAVVEADRNVRILEKLDDRKRQEYELQQKRAEQKQLDTIASQRHYLKQLSSAT